MICLQNMIINRLYPEQTQRSGGSAHPPQRSVVQAYASLVPGPIAYSYRNLDRDDWAERGI